MASPTIVAVTVIPGLTMPSTHRATGMGWSSSCSSAAGAVCSATGCAAGAVCATGCAALGAVGATGGGGISSTRDAAAAGASFLI